MTGSHAADDGSFARSTGGAAARGAMLIALAVIIGLVLLAFALDDPGTAVTAADDSTQESTDDQANGDDGTTDDTTAADTDNGATDDATTDASADDGTVTTITEAPAPEEGGPLRAPAEVTVLVANGTGGVGVAGAVSDTLKTRGYIAEASNAEPAVSPESVIYYRETYAGDAREVATIVGTTADLLQPMPEAPGVAQNAIDDGRLAAAQIVVIVGTDGLIPFG